MSSIYNFHKNISRMGLITGLSAIMLVSLAACGGTTTPLEPSATNTTISTSLATPVPTSSTAMDTGTAAPEPVATGTASSMDMSPDTAGATQAPVATSDAVIATPSSVAGSSNGSVVEIKGTLREWAIDLSQKEVAAGKVRFTVTNTGQFSHNFTIKDAGGEIAKTPNFGASAGPQMLEVDLKPGTYTIICDLPGHAARGQKTELMVK